MRWIILESVIQNEVSQKRKISYINTYIWNLEKWYMINLFEGQQQDFLNGSPGKEPACNAEIGGVANLILGSGRFPGEGNGTPLWYSCLKNFMERVAWWAMVLRITNSQT